MGETRVGQWVVGSERGRESGTKRGLGGGGVGEKNTTFWGKRGPDVAISDCPSKRENQKGMKTKFLGGPNLPGQ